MSEPHPNGHTIESGRFDPFSYSYEKTDPRVEGALKLFFSDDGPYPDATGVMLEGHVAALKWWIASE